MKKEMPHKYLDDLAFRNQICQFCGYMGEFNEWQKGFCPKCNNETKAEKHLKSIADSLSIIANWCNENWIRR